MRESALVINDAEVIDITTAATGKALRASGLLDDAFLEGWTIERVLATRPRPEVSTYLKPLFQTEHLAKFKGKVYRFTLESTINDFKMIGREDGFAFVLSEEDALKIMNEANGDVAKIEIALQLPKGQFQNALSNPAEPDRLLLIEVKNPENIGLKMATGNERGANEFWNSGGYTAEPGRIAEAVINTIPTDRSDLYTKIIVAKTK